MSGDCDLCGSYDHVETSCDAFQCRTCRDEGRVRVSLFAPLSEGFEPWKPCPDCQEDRP